MSFTYGVIEGLYDPERVWTWQARHEYVEFCAKRGFDFFIYAPKNDSFLREQWYAPWPDAELEALRSLRDAFHAKGIRFGIGFTPFEVQALESKVREQLRAKLALINSIKPAMLSILFDDFNNDVTNLAEAQAEIADFIAGESNADQFQVVGTFYSKDPLLSRVYGAKPSNYWSEMGTAFDSKFDIFWTGDHVISLGFDEPGLAHMAELFRRKPFLWDNYPVNDPAWLKQRLRIYSFSGRPWQLSQWTNGHAVNPMIQPRLSKIPLATLADIYRLKDRFVAHSSFKSVLYDICGRELAGLIEDNLIYLTEEGSGSLSEKTVNRIKEEFGRLSEPDELLYVAEIMRWLDIVSEKGSAPVGF